MMFDIVMYNLGEPYVGEDLVVETVESVMRADAARYIILVHYADVVLADAYTHEPDPEDEQTLLDLVRVRGSTC